MALPAESQDIKRYLANWKEECESAALYRIMADHERNRKIAEVYRKLAETEEAHAENWAKRLREAGGDVPRYRPSLRTRVLMRLIRHFGVTAVVPALSRREIQGSHDYSRQPEAADMIRAEQSHARLLREITKTTQGGMEGSSLARLEGRHRSAGGNALRAAVLGASDGLLSNFNLIAGAAGAEFSNRNILLAGFAGLLAGGISMALGEWVSVQSTRELYQKQISSEKEEIAAAPEEEVEELVLIYQARGMDEAAARKVALGFMSNPETAINALARDELGIDAEELGGSAWEASVTSFLLFAIGAVIPVIPFIFLQGTAAIVTSASLSAVGLFAIGSAITLFTGRSILYSGMRQVLFGLAAAAAVFLVGHLIGVRVSG
ncbi:MAG TPA: VIT1/CCC1 family protein [Nitrospirota bacterium]|nr:VIT1/CCC1 family protein [Nitrospirota bacterium]